MEIIPNYALQISKKTSYLNPQHEGWDHLKLWSLFVFLLFTWRAMTLKSIIFELQRPESANQKISNDVLQHSLQAKI